MLWLPQILLEETPGGSGWIVSDPEGIPRAYVLLQLSQEVSANSFLERAWYIQRDGYSRKSGT